MFDNPNPIGRSWRSLAVDLDGAGAVVRWSGLDPLLVGCTDARTLLAAWRDPQRTNEVLSALVRLAAVDGGRDDDALVVLLHLLGGRVRRLVWQLGDLSPDITAIVLSELTCQIRSYRWRDWRGSVAANLELQTRRAVLDDVLLRDRHHIDRREVHPRNGLVWEGESKAPAHVENDIDVVDLLRWAARRGVPVEDLQLLVDSESARGRFGARADERVAAARGIARRTLLRRRARTLEALRALAPAYLAESA